MKSKSKLLEWMITCNPYLVKLKYSFEIINVNEEYTLN